MKRLFLLMFSLLSVAAQASPDGIQVSLNGKALAPHPDDSTLVREKIGRYVAQLKVNDYLLHHIGLDGAFSVCFTPVDEAAKNEILIDLDATPIHPESSFSVRTVEKCQREE